MELPIIEVELKQPFPGLEFGTLISIIHTFCNGRQTHLNVKDVETPHRHFMMECRKFAAICNKYFKDPTLSNMVDDNRLSLQRFNLAMMLNRHHL